MRVTPLDLAIGCAVLVLLLMAASDLVTGAVRDGLAGVWVAAMLLVVHARSR